MVSTVLSSRRGAESPFPRAWGAEYPQNKTDQANKEATKK